MILTDSKLLSVREMEQKDIQKIADYWLKSDPEYLKTMGVDLNKLPSEQDFGKPLQTQLQLPYHQKKTYTLIWELAGTPVGHSNLTPISFGNSAYIHIHLWDKRIRKLGLGTQFIKMSLPIYFNNMQLKKLYCEPYAHNPAPNRALDKLGFKFIKNHITNPGTITFEQLANLWELSKENAIGVDTF